MSIEKARAARDAAYLEKFVRTRRWGIITRREHIERLIEAGGRLEVREFADHAKRARLERQLEQMRRGWIPWGNPNHPETIKAQALKDALAGRVTSPEYVIWDPFEPDVYHPQTKTAYKYALAMRGNNA